MRIRDRALPPGEGDLGHGEPALSEGSERRERFLFRRTLAAPEALVVDEEALERLELIQPGRELFMRFLAGGRKGPHAREPGHGQVERSNRKHPPRDASAERRD